jgi:L-alanine-DL-glutamate epimerase-like enolase superfamily enzyme
MPKITSIQARVVRIPLANSTAFSNRVVTAREYCLARIRTDDGLEGIGHCYGGHAGANIVSLAVRELLAPLLMGADPTSSERLWKIMFDEALLQGRSGSVMRALSILDIAIWDRNARAANLPLYKYLGAACEGSVPAYGSGGYYLQGKTPEMLGAEMVSYVALGFDAVKMKVGRGDVKSEEARVAAVRRAIGPDVLLMLDANNAWCDLPTALRYMQRFAPFDPYWIEEPFAPDQIDNHVNLASAINFPIATGEIEAGRWRFKELLDRRAASILQPDAAVCGGITEFRRIAALADGYGVPLCPHWFHDLNVHLVASSPNCKYVEYFPDAKVLNFREILDRQLIVEKGRLRLPDEPGLGYLFDEKRIAGFESDAWH